MSYLRHAYKALTVMITRLKNKSDDKTRTMSLVRPALIGATRIMTVISYQDY